MSGVLFSEHGGYCDVFFLCVLALLLFGGYDEQRGFLLGSIPLIAFGEIFSFFGMVFPYLS